MVNKALSYRRLLLMTLGLTYIATGMLGSLPSASLIRLAIVVVVGEVQVG